MELNEGRREKKRRIENERTCRERERDVARKGQIIREGNRGGRTNKCYKNA